MALAHERGVAGMPAGAGIVSGVVMAGRSPQNLMGHFSNLQISSVEGADPPR